MSTNPIQSDARERASNDDQAMVDVSALCALEQIQFLGEVQEHGFLLELSSDWIVRRASTNIGQFLPVDHFAILGLSAAEVLGRKVVHDLRSQLQIGDASGGVEAVLGAHIAGDDRQFDLRIHRSSDNLIVEGEVSVASSETMQLDVQKMLIQLQRLGNIEGVAKTAVRQVRALSGYDRVMCYRFHDDDSGEVIAESRRSGIEPFLGLRYPASDIPPQARALYLRNPLRAISDVTWDTYAVEPRIDVHGQRLDLSMADLRAVSPTHIQYLKNMGVAASMSLSIVVNGKLWGLLACHHHSGRVLSVATRQTLSTPACCPRRSNPQSARRCCNVRPMLVSCTCACCRACRAKARRWTTFFRS
ncbi:GAF domain-containing protein [Sphingomonas kaistensis]|uniref:GAF domain-containing protein n=1 Tax=Sphingomonas kaistensis TaxID=298708 RepID=A0ABZ2G1R2_9SPHN